AERAAPELAYQARWLQQLEREHNNIRAALEWSIRYARRECGMRLCGALWQFWHIRGHIAEGYQWCSQVLDDSPAVAHAVRARAFTGAGVLAWAHGQYLEAQQHHERALELYRELGDQGGIADNLESLGHIQIYLRDYARAMILY